MRLSGWVLGSVQLLCMILFSAVYLCGVAVPVHTARVVWHLLCCCCRRRQRQHRTPLAWVSRPRCVLITGASSGIGEALALRYAGQGDKEGGQEKEEEEGAVLLALTGRDQGRLEDVAARCRRLGAQVVARVVDVCDAEGMRQFVGEVHALRPLDLVFANAGVNFATAGGSSFSQACRALFAINVDGVLNTVLPASELQARAGRGSLVLVSSLAAHSHLYSIGDGEGSPYSATKAAVKQLGLHMRRRFAGSGVRVSVVCPGYVTTRITKALGMGKLPLEMPADKACDIIHQGLLRNDAVIAFPAIMDTLAYCGSVLPESITEHVVDAGVALVRWWKKKKGTAKAGEEDSSKKQE